MATQPHPTTPPPKPAPPPDPKPAAVAKRSEGVGTHTPYPDDHYDTPNDLSEETVADEQRKRSDAMTHAPGDPPPLEERHKK